MLKEKDKEKKEKEVVDKNFFNAMSYELAGEIGILDNEDMKKNKKLKIFWKILSFFVWFYVKYNFWSG